jgi:hypothetical protein
MDHVMNSHFQFEASENMQALLGTVSDEILHDQVGNPLGPRRGKAQMREFYEALFADTEQTGVTPLHREYGETFAVDDILWEGYTTGTAFGLKGYPRSHVSFRLLHVFDFQDGLITRENVWIDYPALEAQLSAAPAEK